MDNWDGGSLKNLFTTKAEPEPLGDGAVAPQNVCEINHARRSGETYNQYGFRVAGLSEGSTHTLLPCLQSVYFSIKKEQEEDDDLQRDLIQKLQVQVSELEGEKDNKRNQIEASEKTQDSVAEEIEEKKRQLADLKDGGRVKNRNAWITLIISGILLVPFSIYFFIFYSSVGYSAFFKQFDVNNIVDSAVLASAIFDSHAIQNAYNDGIAELMFILFMPVIFLAFGFVLNRWEREEGKLKYVKIPLLILVAFIFDTLLSYEICQKLYALKILTTTEDLPPYDMMLALKDPQFWVIICLGFVSYLIWGFVFGFFVKAWENLDLNPIRRKEIEEQIGTLKNRLGEEQKKCLDLKSGLNAIDPQIRELQSQMSVSARYDIGKIKLELSNFFAGWQQYLAALHRTDEEKQQALDIYSKMVDSIKVVE